MSSNKETDSNAGYSDELLEGHEYDGIQEYGNPIPGWLSLVFIGTIVWSVMYVVGINLGYIDRYQESLEESQEEIAKLRAKAQAGQPSIDKEMLVKVTKKDDRIAQGKETYKSKCVSCHGEKLGGTVGPNLADKYWIHGGSLTEIYETVKTGIPAKGMPPWQPQLTKDEMANVVAFIDSKRGDPPKGGKKPEGEPYKPKSN